MSRDHRRPFQGVRGANQVASVTSTSGSVTIPKGNKSIRLVNSGTSFCYVRIGKGAQTATSADTPVLEKESVVLRKAKDSDTVAYLCPTTTTLHIQPGEGSGRRFRTLVQADTDFYWENLNTLKWEEETVSNWENWE
tara:strand:- start:3 stop:413 length:411 start_codon:yes stop_codon:yes gene_type:complete